MVWTLLQHLDRHFEEWLAGITLLVMSALVFAQVVMRYLFTAPMSWSDEIAVYCMVWSVYLAGSWAVRERTHIRVLNFIRLFPRKVQLVLVAISELIWLCCNVFIFYQGILLDISMWEQHYVSPVLNIDQKWPYLIIAVGFGLMIFRQFQLYYLWIRYGQLPLELSDPMHLHEEPSI